MTLVHCMHFYCILVSLGVTDGDRGQVIDASATGWAGYPLLVTADKRKECQVDRVHVNWSDRKNVAFLVNVLGAWNWTDKDAPDSLRVALTFPQRYPSCFPLPHVFTRTSERHQSRITCIRLLQAVCAAGVNGSHFLLFQRHSDLSCCSHSAVKQDLAQRSP